ncbi:MAG: DUF86 domain-containing protein [Thermoplasmata archaeon]|nr:MAG: DUF86 domain-containing protein [Thermoplasmata archaeon]
MNEKIEERIMEKMEILIDRIEFINENISDEMVENRILKKALYKEFQEAIEAMTDICALIRRGLNSSAKDDYTNIDFLVEKKVIGSKTGKKMKEANGLRNRLIHEYDGLNDMLAYESMKELVNHLKSFSQEVLKWMKKES